MKYLFLSLCIFTTLNLFACTQTQAIKSATNDAVVGQVHQSEPFGELVCYEGAVCKKIELLSLVEESGVVNVRLRNRSSKNMALQLSLEWLGSDGAINEGTAFFDIPIAPRQVGQFVIHGPSEKAERIRVVVRDRRAL